MPLCSSPRKDRRHERGSTIFIPLSMAGLRYSCPNLFPSTSNFRLRSLHSSTTMSYKDPSLPPPVFFPDKLRGLS